MKKKLLLSSCIIVSLGLHAPEALSAGCASELSEESEALQFLTCLREMQAEINRLAELPLDNGETGVLPTPEAVAASLIRDHKGELPKGDPGDAGVAPTPEAVAAILIRDHKDELPKGNDAALPADIIVASTAVCSALGEKGSWTEFKEGTGRFIVGAGTKTHLAYGKWQMARSDGGFDPMPITTHDVLAYGGEEKHILNDNELPKHAHRYEDIGFRVVSPVPPNTFGGFREPAGGQGYATAKDTTEYGGSLPHNNMPPYIALYFCKKEG